MSPYMRGQCAALDVLKIVNRYDAKLHQRYAATPHEVKYGLLRFVGMNDFYKLAPSALHANVRTNASLWDGRLYLDAFHALEEVAVVRAAAD